jgi:molybdopterin/thiamine biosynthesis adenylyltransferase
MIDPKYLIRQEEILPIEKTGKSIIIVGAGAIGSFTALSLAKMGYDNITVYDFDTIDDANMNCQFYRMADIGRKKVDALRDLVEDFTGSNIKVFDKRVEPTDILRADMIITAVDSIAVRKQLFETSACQHLIDPRMGAEYASMEVVNMFDSNQKENYARTLYSSDEVVHERCTAKATMYTVNLLSGQVAKAVKDISTNNAYIKCMDWNIKTNNIIAFDSRGQRL